jgi:hypothetical protein
MDFEVIAHDNEIGILHRAGRAMRNDRADPFIDQDPIGWGWRTLRVLKCDSWELDSLIEQSLMEMDNGLIIPTYRITPLGEEVGDLLHTAQQHKILTAYAHARINDQQRVVNGEIDNAGWRRPEHFSFPVSFDDLNHLTRVGLLTGNAITCHWQITPQGAKIVKIEI